MAQLLPISAALIATELARRALTQLNWNAVFPMAGVLDYEAGAFSTSNEVSIRRPKQRTAVLFDPREGALDVQEAEFFKDKVVLESLFADAYPVYSHDPNRSYQLYLDETATQIGDAIARPTDKYIASKFRSYDPSAGKVYLGASAPLGITAIIDPTTGKFAKMTSDGVLNATVYLESQDVPKENLYGVLSTVAGGGLQKDAVNFNNYAAAQIAGANGAANLLLNGVMQGQFVQRYNVNCASSNSITGQSAIAALDSAPSANLAIASVAENTLFFHADKQPDTLVGALDITLTANTALSSSVAVGQIARIGSSSANAQPTGFGVILRINTTTATAPIITMAVYTPEGRQLRAGEITAGTDTFSIPLIPSVNHVFHKEALLIANRNLINPSPGSGAVGAFLRNPKTNMTINLYSGNFEVLRLREQTAAYYLVGAKISDGRKACHVLSL